MAQKDGTGTEVEIDVFVTINIPEASSLLVVAVGRRNALRVKFSTPPKEVGPASNQLVSFLIEFSRLWNTGSSSEGVFLLS